MELNYFEPVFSISTAAKLLDVSVHTLRMYEREGLIIPFKKDSSQRLTPVPILTVLNVSEKQLTKVRSA
jgi:predicted site-specific integrase-resolvase